MALSGQGWDCSWTISGSASGFGNISFKGGKQSFNAKKKPLTAAGSTVGYKYYDHWQDLSIDFVVQGGSGNTGTLQAGYPSVGTTVTITNAVQNHITGSWSLDKLDFNAAEEDVETGTMTLWRAASVTPS